MNLHVQMEADLEQAETAMEHLAKMVCNYYKELIEQGVPPELAFSLTTDFQYHLLNLSKKD